MALSLPIEDKANELLARDPLALLIGMVLDHYIRERMLDVWQGSWYSEHTGATSRA